MADTKISDLTALTGANVADDDEFVIVDTSAAQSKRITRAELAQGLYQGDNVTLKIGAGSDLQIYHDGVTNNSYISELNPGGSLFIDGSNIFLRSSGGEEFFKAVANAQVEIYYDDAIKLSTTSTGIDVTGTVTADGLTVGNGTQQSRMYIDADEVSELIDGNVRYDIWTGGTKTMRLAANGDISFYDSTGTSQNLFWDASAGALLVGKTAQALATVGAEILGSIGRIQATRDSGAPGGFNRKTNDGDIVAFYKDATQVGSIGSSAGNSIFIGTSDVAVRFSNVNAAIYPITTAGLNKDAATDLGISSVRFRNLYLSGGTKYGSSSDFGQVRKVSNELQIDSYGTAGARHPIKFTQYTTEVGRWDSSGNFLVGTTDINPGFNDTNTGSAIRSAGSIFTSVSGSVAGYFNRNTNDGDIVSFRKDGTTVGSIGNHDATSAYIGSSDTGLRFNVGSDSVTPYDPSTKANRDAAIDLGHPSIRFKDLYLSGTIQIEKGTGNVGVGKLALNSNTSSNNTAVGYSAMSANTTGVNISSVGHTSLQANTTGSSLVAVGTSALYANTTGSFSVAIGQQALRFNTTASNNTAVGHQAGYSNTNNANTFVGYQAGYSTNNVGNTFCGASAGSSVTSGSKNTIVGRFNGNENGLDIRTASNRIVLSDGDGNPRAYWGAAGEMVTQSSSTSDYALRAASTNTTGYPIISEFTGGAPNNTTNRFFTCRDTSADRMYVYSNGNVVNTNNSYGALSDEKLKENIVDSGSQWDDIKALRVRKYSMKEDALDAPNKLGVIAQELEAAGMGGLVFESPDRDRDNNDLGTVTKQVNYSILYMKAVKALQEAMERIETLEAKVTALENA